MTNPAQVPDEQLVRSLSAGEAATVWEAARSLRPRDYSLLDLSLRRQFSDQDIAEIAALSRSTVQSTLSRLQSALEDSFASAALYVSGTEACADLKELVEIEPEL